MNDWYIFLRVLTDGKSRIQIKFIFENINYLLKSTVKIGKSRKGVV